MTHGRSVIILILLVLYAGIPALALPTLINSDEALLNELAQNQENSLNVALYPYITDVNRDNNTHMLSIMKQQFQAENPSINLTVTMSPENDCYNLSNLPTIFSPDGPQLIEIDLSLLGYLVDKGYLKPYENSSLTNNVKSQAIPAGVFKGATYAIPTWTCSEFLFSKNPEIQGIQNVKDLSTVLEKYSPNYPVMLVGDFQAGGEWMLPMLYVFAYTDNWGFNRTWEGMVTENQTSINTMTTTMGWCTADGTNNCLNGYYFNHSPTKIFVRNDSFSFVGFSENLYNIKKLDPNSTYYTVPSPFGNEQNPLFWADGLIINKNACDDQCRTQQASLSRITTVFRRKT